MAIDQQAQLSAYDVVVAGSGIGGMATAIAAAKKGLKVLLVEKAPVFGGTTARSGGWLWVPGSSLAKKYGHIESAGLAEQYIRDQAGAHFDEARVRQFLADGPEAIDFFMKETQVQFDMPLLFPDYHAEAPGGVQGGRSMVTRPYDARDLDKDLLKTLAPPINESKVFGMTIGSGKDIVHFLRATRSLESFWYVAKRLSRHFLDVLKYGQGMTLTLGHALAARLGQSARDAGVEVWLSAPLVDVLTENGRVTGVVVEKEGKKVEVRARHGVVLATGGFPHNIALRKRLYKHAPTGMEHWTPAAPGNVGDGARIAENAGGYFDEKLSDAAAWTPMSLVPLKDGSKGIFPHFIDRAKPGTICVSQQGKRFTNESNSYHDFVRDMVRTSEGEKETCAWMIADHRSIRRYGMAFAKPFPFPVNHYVRIGYLKKGRTPEELAREIGVDPATLAQTIRGYNEHAKNGQDPVFGRGSKAYNRYQGDALHGPNPCIAPLADGPYYALKLLPGELGSFMGIRVNKDSAVVTADGHVVEGLFAVGNDASSVFGGEYIGAGITLGPGLVQGYGVAKAMAEKNGAAPSGNTAQQKLAV